MRWRSSFGLIVLEKKKSNLSRVALLRNDYFNVRFLSKINLLLKNTLKTLWILSKNGKIWKFVNNVHCSPRLMAIAFVRQIVALSTKLELFNVSPSFLPLLSAFLWFLGAFWLVLPLTHKRFPWARWLLALCTRRSLFFCFLSLFLRFQLRILLC